MDSDDFFDTYIDLDYKHKYKYSGSKFNHYNFKKEAKTVFHPGKLPQKPIKKTGKKFASTSTFYTLEEMGSFIPISALHSSYQPIVCFTKNTIKDRHESVQALFESVNKLRLNKRKIDTLNLLENAINKKLLFELDQRIHTMFRKFVQRWIYKKYKDRFLNTDDPATLCPPVKPVIVFDVNARGSFVFEASTLKKMLEHDLLYSEWMFPCSIEPKNPLNNLKFTQGQIIYLIDTLKLIGHGSWILDGYKSCKLDIVDFRNIYKTPIKLNALDDIVKNKKANELQEHLIDFIEEEYDYHSQDMDSLKYLIAIKWAVKNMVDHPYMKEWINILKIHHTQEIIHGFTDPNSQVSKDIHYITSRLLNDHKVLKLYNNHNVLKL
jgi:hypothetical protein